MGRGIDQALAPGSPAIAPDHVGGGTGLIEKDEALSIHIALPHAPALAVLCDIRPILLGSSQRLLWDGPPLLHCQR